MVFATISSSMSRETTHSPLAGARSNPTEDTSSSGELGSARRRLHGKTSLVEHDGRGVFAGLPQQLEVGRYHSLAAVRVPEELEVSARAEDMRFLADLAATGAFKPVIDRSYPLGQAREALRHMIEDEVRGKVILTAAEPV